MAKPCGKKLIGEKEYHPKYLFKRSKIVKQPAIKLYAHPYLPCVFHDEAEVKALPTNPQYYPQS